VIFFYSITGGSVFQGEILYLPFYIRRCQTLLKPQGYLGCNVIKPAALITSSDGTFPHHPYPPTQFQEGRDILLVALPVASEFIPPESRMSRRNTELGTMPVTMPETAVHKHNCFELREHNIGRARQLLIVLAETQPQGKQTAPQQHLGL